MCRTQTLNELMKTAEGNDRSDKDEEMRQDKRASIEMDTGTDHDKPTETRNEEERREWTRGNEGKSSIHKNEETGNTAKKGNVQYGGCSSSTSQAVPSSEVRSADAKADQQGGEASTKKRERSGSMQIEQPRIRFEKTHKGSATTTAAAERLDKKHKGSDSGMVEDVVIVQIEAGKMAKKTERDVITKMLAERNPDTMVTLSVTVNERETDSKADIEESTKFAMRVCQDQISRNRYFAHVWLRWSKVWSKLEVSRMVHMNNVKDVDFDMCRYGHLDKGLMRMLTNSLHVVEKENRKCPSQRHAAWETDVKIQDNSIWAAVLCRAIHAGTEDQIRDDHHKRTEITDDQLDKKKVAESMP